MFVSEMTKEEFKEYINDLYECPFLIGDEHIEYNNIEHSIEEWKKLI